MVLEGTVAQTLFTLNVSLMSLLIPLSDVSVLPMLLTVDGDVCEINFFPVIYNTTFCIQLVLSGMTCCDSGGLMRYRME